MDPVTSSIALSIVQICLAIVMAGVYCAAPHERCTRYWASSGLLIGVGIFVTVLSLPTQSYVGLTIGNTCLFAGAVVVWMGLQAFYRRRASYWGWILIALFAVIFVLLLVSKAGYAARAHLSSASLLLTFLLSLKELWQGKPFARAEKISFARGMAYFALSILITAHTARLAISFRDPSVFHPDTIAHLGAIILFLAPLAGALLFFAALLLLFFERIIGEKHRLATQDALTGTLNRRAVTMAGEGLIAHAQRHRRTLTVAFVDVDHFKKINDQFGHQAGDHVLSELALILKHNCRPNDLVGRYGGEEFCIIFPDMEHADAEVVARRLIDAVQQHPFSHQNPVTISAGIAVLQHGESLTWEGFVQLADVALYKAKNEGRNRFCVAPSRSPARTEAPATRTYARELA